MEEKSIYLKLSHVKYKTFCQYWDWFAALKVEIKLCQGTIQSLGVGCLYIEAMSSVN